MIFLDNNLRDSLQRDKFSGIFLILYHVSFLFNEHNLINKLPDKAFTFTLAILYVFVK